MLEVDIVKWVNEVIYKSQHGELPEDYDAMTELIMKCFEGSFEAMDIPGTKDEVVAAIENDFKVLIPVIKRFDELWKYLIVHIKEAYQVDIPRYYHFGFIIYCCGLVPNPIERAFGLCARYYMDHCMPDIPKTKHEERMKSSEWFQQVANFFDKFKDLGTYYSDPDKYETEEDRQKHRELTDMFFNDIMPR